MADPRNVIVEIKNGLSDVRQQMNLLKQETQSWASTLGTGLSKLQAAGGSGGSSGGVSSNQVAPNPKFTPPTSPNAPSNTVATGGSGGSGGGTQGGGSGGGGRGGSGGGSGSDYSGNTSLTRYVTENAASGFLYTAAVTSGLLDKPGESVEAQLLMSRTGYFNKGARNALEAQAAYKDIQKTQAELSFQATTKDKMDVMRGLAAAQSIGITGPNVTQAAGGMGSVASGVANVSNLLPGAGFEGTMRAYSSMQQGRNVNMLRGIGIQLRDANGNMKPPDQIIDDLWKKICRDYAGAYGSGKTPSEREVLIGLQPGNSMDSMLDIYFGNDPMAKQLVANGLLYKAKTKGASISKDTLTELGATTAAVNAQTYRNAAGATQTGATADAGAKGYASAAKALGDFSLTMTEKFLPELKALTETNAKLLTFMGAGNDTGKKTLALLATKGGIFALAAAGLLAATGILPIGGLGGAESASADTGTTGGSSSSGSSSGGGSGNPRDFAITLLKKLGAPITESSIEAMMIWQKKEGGHWRNSADYNPLNTTLPAAGATSINSVGVKAYTNWEQGVEATYDTLTGKNSKARGYDKIVELLKEGASREAILSAIASSAWAGAGGYGADGFKGITPTYNVGSQSSTDSVSNTFNYGGVTYNITGTDPDAIAKAIQKHFEELNAQKAAANK